MINHLIAVVVCWLIAGCGFAMFRYATSPYGQVAGHGAVFVSMLSLSAMALDHDHRAQHPSPDLYTGSIKESVYHIGGCPLPMPRDVIFRSAQEAAWAGMHPCTFCLPEEPQYHVAHYKK